MTELLEIIKNYDIHTILSMAAIFWFMSRGIRSDIKDIKFDLARIKEDIRDLDRRLCRIEGALSAKECCILKDEQRLKKVE